MSVGGKTAASHLIQDEGTSLRPRPYLNFTGSGAACTDSGGKTVCDFSGGGGSIGIGTANTITFWPTTTTIGSLPTATYPSLTELSYSKGVTSAIQTQIDGLSVGSGGWTDGGTNIFLTATTDSVGIGTTGASGSLEIAKQGSAIPFMVSSTATGDGDYIIVKSSGNVGIGTTIPLTSVAFRASPVTVFSVTSTGASGSSSGAGIQAYVDDGAAVVQGDRLAFYTFGGSADTGDTMLSGAALTGFADGTYSATSAPSELRFETAPAGSTTRTARMYVKSAGSIGIGTANPESMLQVSGDTRIGNGTFTNTSANEDLYVEGNLEADGTIYGNVTGALTGNSSTVTFADAASDTTTFVALGTAATGSLAPATDSALSYNASTNALTAGSFIGDGSALTGISAGGWTDGGTNVFTTLTTDNVGIGTTTPSANLEIVKAGNYPLMVSATSIGDGDYLIIDSSGNVGIGTNSPQEKFHIKSADTDFRLETTTNSAFTSFQLLNDVGQAGFEFGGSASSLPNTLLFNNETATGDISFGTNDTVRMTVDETGNVGIGTASPMNNLQINGTLQIDNTGNAGGSVRTGANTACNTTCVSACMIGFDTGTLGVSLAHIVGCADASADECFCMGPS